jgi:hypothetical protein
MQFMTPIEEDPILRSFAEYDSLVQRAEKLYLDGRYAAASVVAAVGAGVAAQRHCGVFASPRIEKLLISIGNSLRTNDASTCDRAAPVAIKSVLHVATQLSPVGGLTRMISRWVNADKSRTNSLVLTQHRGPIPRHTE